MMQGSRAGERVGDKVRGVAQEAEAEVARLIAYMNDQVVPEVRRSSSVALRVASEQLARMAEHLDRASARRPAATEAGPAGFAAEAARGSNR